MMRLLLYGVMASLLPATVSAQSPYLQRAVRAGGLPPGVQPALSAPIHGVKGARAIAFRSTKNYLGVVLGRQLVWKTSLPAMPEKLWAPSHSGLFAAWVSLSHGARFYAYSLHGQSVRSGIDGVTSGHVSGDEGGSFWANAVTVKNLDARHQGTVKYRLRDQYRLCSAGFCKVSETRTPDYPVAQYPTPNGVIRNKHGDTLLLKLEVADTEQERELGLMHRSSLDADSGMVFVWSAPVLESFWMDNTLIPLSIAFVASDGTILEMQDMAPQTQDLHTPKQPYQYAIEVNQGYFAQYDIRAGDKVQLHLANSSRLNGRNRGQTRNGHATVGRRLSTVSIREGMLRGSV